MLAQQKADGGLNKGAQGKIQQHVGQAVVTNDRLKDAPKLADAGISKDLSSRAQKLAAVPEAEFEAEVGQWRERVTADWRHPQHMAASHVLAEARKAEAKALAGLRKACRAADPQSRVIDVEAREPLANRWLTHGLPRPLHGRA